jgi:hypothetical protein
MPQGVRNGRVALLPYCTTSPLREGATKGEGGDSGIKGLGSRGCGIPHAREMFPRSCGTRLRVNFGLGRDCSRKGREGRDGRTGAPTKSGPIERFRLEWLSDPIG